METDETNETALHGYLLYSIASVTVHINCSDTYIYQNLLISIMGLEYFFGDAKE